MEELKLPKTQGWVCPKCKKVWNPDIDQCKSKTCQPVDEQSSENPRTFLTE